MESDRLGRIRTDHLYQPFCERLNALITACEARSCIYVATSGLRTYEEQEALYERGRTLPGGIVTKARGGQSPHQFYCAVDFCKHAGSTYTGKLIPDYRNSQYEVLAQEAERLGLESGLRWKFKDSPHIQLPVKAHGLRWVDLDSAYRQGGHDAVIALLDSKGPW
jgi:peptidoglycan L-alanyl-D-glutamate endopeptidase CwlK